MALLASSIDPIVARVPDRRAFRSIRNHPDTAIRQPSEAADIERVSALLRRLQPDLVVRRDEVAGDQAPPMGPAWLVIGVVWTTTLVLIAAATTALVLLVG
jgi:hypothetical protein